MSRLRRLLDRRSFIASLSALTISLSAPLILGTDGRDSRSLRDLVLQLLGIFPNPDALIAIGKQYLDLHGDGDLAQLVALLRNRNREISAGDLMDEVVLLIKRDFSVGDVALVDGWVLSRTEARLCALTSLSLS